MFVLYMRSELDLCLKASEFTGLLKGDRMGAIQNVITSLRGQTKTCQGHPDSQTHLQFLESFKTAATHPQCLCYSILDVCVTNKTKG